MIQNKYKEGEVVFEKARPYQKLIVERYLDKLYYCKLQEAPHRKALVFLEKDLSADDQK
jgi:hypothetical protein